MDQAYIDKHKADAQKQYGVRTVAEKTYDEVAKLKAWIASMLFALSVAKKGYDMRQQVNMWRNDPTALQQTQSNLQGAAVGANLIYAHYSLKMSDYPAWAQEHAIVLMFANSNAHQAHTMLAAHMLAENRKVWDMGVNPDPNSGVGQEWVGHGHNPWSGEWTGRYNRHQTDYLEELARGRAIHPNEMAWFRNEVGVQQAGPVDMLLTNPISYNFLMRATSMTVARLGLDQAAFLVNVNQVLYMSLGRISVVLKKMAEDAKVAGLFRDAGHWLVPKWVTTNMDTPLGLSTSAGRASGNMGLTGRDVVDIMDFSADFLGAASSISHYLHKGIQTQLTAGSRFTTFKYHAEMSARGIPGDMYSHAGQAALWIYRSSASTSAWAAAAAVEAAAEAAGSIHTMARNMAGAIAGRENDPFSRAAAWAVGDITEDDVHEQMQADTEEIRQATRQPPPGQDVAFSESEDFEESLRSHLRKGQGKTPTGLDESRAARARDDFTNQDIQATRGDILDKENQGMEANSAVKTRRTLDKTRRDSYKNEEVARARPPAYDENEGQWVNSEMAEMMKQMALAEAYLDQAYDLLGIEREESKYSGDENERLEARLSNIEDEWQEVSERFSNLAETDRAQGAELQEHMNETLETAHNSVSPGQSIGASADLNMPENWWGEGSNVNGAVDVLGIAQLAYVTSMGAYLPWSGWSQKKQDDVEWYDDKAGKAIAATSFGYYWATKGFAKTVEGGADAAPGLAGLSLGVTELNDMMYQWAKEDSGKVDSGNIYYDQLYNGIRKDYMSQTGHAWMDAGVASSKGQQAAKDAKEGISSGAAGGLFGYGLSALTAAGTGAGAGAEAGGEGGAVAGTVIGPEGTLAGGGAGAMVGAVIGAGVGLYMWGTHMYDDEHKNKNKNKSYDKLSDAEYQTLLHDLTIDNIDNVAQSWLTDMGLPPGLWDSYWLAKGEGTKADAESEYSLTPKGINSMLDMELTSCMKAGKQYVAFNQMFYDAHGIYPDPDHWDDGSSEMFVEWMHNSRQDSSFVGGANFDWDEPGMGGENPVWAYRDQDKSSPTYGQVVLTSQPYPMLMNGMTMAEFKLKESLKGAEGPMMDPDGNVSQSWVTYEANVSAYMTMLTSQAGLIKEAQQQYEDQYVKDNYLVGSELPNKEETKEFNKMAKKYADGDITKEEMDAWEEQWQGDIDDRGRSEVEIADSAGIDRAMGEMELFVADMYSYLQESPYYDPGPTAWDPWDQTTWTISYTAGTRDAYRHVPPEQKKEIFEALHRGGLMPDIPGYKDHPNKSDPDPDNNPHQREWETGLIKDADGREHPPGYEYDEDGRLVHVSGPDVAGITGGSEFENPYAPDDWREQWAKTYAIQNPESQTQTVSDHMRIGLQHSSQGVAHGTEGVQQHDWIDFDPTWIWPEFDPNHYIPYDRNGPHKYAKVTVQGPLNQAGSGTGGGTSHKINGEMSKKDMMNQVMHVLTLSKLQERRG